MRDLSPVIFRGERDGTLKASGGAGTPYFFAERYDQAALYAGRGTLPVAAVVQGSTVLDITELDRRNPVHCKVMAELIAEFDDWTCRYSGEPVDAWDIVQAGALYDYEGTGSAERWKALLSFALEDFDAVRVLDRTDGTQGEAVSVWVVPNGENIRLATFGEHLAALVSVPSVETARPWAGVQNWLERDHPDVLARINRLRLGGDDYQLPRLSSALPPHELSKVTYPHGSSEHLAVWRALPEGSHIRPGDWVALNSEYAAQHKQEHSRGVVKSLSRVAPSDVYWAGTDDQKFFFLPEAWRIDAPSAEAYLRALTPDQIRILGDGEVARITQLANPIESIRKAVMGSFDPEACGDYHGPDHWARVNEHAMAVARSLGVDPLVPRLFALVHDSQRLDDGEDPEHGPRAAQFVRDQRTNLFVFLSDDDHAALVDACDRHSDGLTDAPTVVQACWDADRLDLWRVGVEPEPKYLCSAYAQLPSVIEDALQLWRTSNESGWSEAVGHEAQLERT